ncbi:MAG TPA: hypothetical protein VJ805_05070 [Nitrospiraceae bacterium]|nr:hypothetical protein [Nitrospiraceae bacterium]
MLIRPHEHVPIARLLTFLRHGEEMAHDCARRQARLVSNHSRRFLNSQARQEAMHAVVFQGAIAWLAPRHLGDIPFLPALEQYRGLLDEALERGDFYETILAEQVILEGLGEAILMRIEDGLARRQAPFGRLRRILLRQEEGHHQFGRRLLEQAIDSGKLDREAVRSRARLYLELTDAMVVTLSDLFESVQEDASAWASDVRHVLPAWLGA